MVYNFIPSSAIKYFILAQEDIVRVYRAGTRLSPNSARINYISTIDVISRLSTLEERGYALSSPLQPF